VFTIGKNDQLTAQFIQEFLELLASIGFIPVEIRHKKVGEDNILDITGPELNVNGNNTKLLTTILFAALYPNVVKVFSPAKSYAHSGMGVLYKEFRAKELQLNTKDFGNVL
jgi:ATP-dependent RNA helicase DHX57